jgi:hypothetical protein
MLGSENARQRRDHDVKQKSTAYRAAYVAANTLLDAQGIHGKVLWDQATMKSKNRDMGRFC